MLKHLLINFLMTTFFLATAHAAAPQCRHVFERITIENKNLSENLFNVSRGLKAYNQHLPFRRSLEKTLARLPDGSHWVDMGAGQGRALAQGLVKNPTLTATAIAFKKPFDSVPESLVPGRFEYLDGDFVENMWSQGRLAHLAGRVQLITDIYGPLSYSSDLPKLLQIYVDLLKTGGEAQFNLMTSRHSDKAHETMNAVNGADHGLVQWLRTIEGIEVIEIAPFHLDTSSRTHVKVEIADAIRIIKRANRVIVPATLQTRVYESGSPPRREFASPLTIKNAEPETGLRAFLRNRFRRN